jgi:hypothetical protein
MDKDRIAAIAARAGRIHLSPSLAHPQLSACARTDSGGETGCAA